MTEKQITSASARRRPSGFFDAARWALGMVYHTEPRLLIALVTLYLALSLVPLAAAFAVRSLLNAIVAAVDSAQPFAGSVNIWVAVTFGLALAATIGEQIVAYVRQNLSLSLAAAFGLRINEHLGRMAPARFESPRFKDMVARASSSAAARPFQFANDILVVATQIVELSALVGALIFIEPLLLPALVPPLLLYFVFRWRLARANYDKDHRRVKQHRYTRYLIHMLSDYNWVFEVHLLALPTVLLAKYRALVERFLQEDRRLLRRAYWGSALFLTGSTLIIYLFFARLVSRIVSGIFTVGDVALYLGVVGRLGFSIQNLLSKIGALREGVLYISDVRQLLDMPADKADDPGTPVTAKSGRLTFRDVTFSYPGSDTPALRQVSFEIEPGEVIALVGPNGSGKSTLAKLMAGLYVPDCGAILLDGADLTSHTSTAWQARVGFVFQQFNRYEATVFENIAYGNWSAMRHNTEKVEQLAKKLGLRSMIDQLPEGYETQLGRMFSDVNLSGGQWQKIALARALARDDALLLILDEPTAGLDAKAEHEIFAEFKALAAGRSTVLISHRFSTVRIADRILVLDEGYLAEHGTHDQLMAQDGQYAQLYRLHTRHLH